MPILDKFPTFRALWPWKIQLPGIYPWYATESQRLALMRLIAVSLEENIPLVPLLESWCPDESGRQYYRLKRLIRLLQEGTSLVKAVELIPGLLNEEDQLALQFDAQSGTRAAALRARLSEQSAASPGQRLRWAIIYAVVVLPIGLLLTMFTNTMIVPKLIYVYGEFKTPLPQALYSTHRFIGPPQLGTILLAVGILCVVYWLFRTRRGRSFRFGLLSRFSRPWHEHCAAEVMRMIGIVIKAGRPIAGALSTLARHHYDPSIRHELLYVRNEVEQGVNVWDSLASVRMLSVAEVQLLETAEALNNRAWVVDQIVQAKQRKLANIRENWSYLWLPIPLLIMVALVALEALLVFEPLVVLIHELV